MIVAVVGHSIPLIDAIEQIQRLPDYATMDLRVGKEDRLEAETDNWCSESSARSQTTPRYKTHFEK